MKTSHFSRGNTKYISIDFFHESSWLKRQSVLIVKKKGSTAGKQQGRLEIRCTPSALNFPARQGGTAAFTGLLLLLITVTDASSRETTKEGLAGGLRCNLSPDLYYKTPTPAPACVTITVDFNTDSWGKSLAGGLYVKREWAVLGLTLSTSGGVGSLPRQFNMANPHGNDDYGDYDLGSPNERCSPPGPGKGEGGEPDGAGPNCEPLGNVLIVQEPNNKPLIPDDNGKGGIISFNFSKPGGQYVQEIGLLDVDEPTQVAIVYEGVGGLLTKDIIDVPEAGDNSVQMLQINKANVKLINVMFKMSGAVMFIKFCPMEFHQRLLLEHHPLLH